MKTNNSFKISGFIYSHFFWGLVSWIWYKILLFRCLPSFSFTESRLALFGLIVISCIVGMFFEMKKNRNKLSLAFNLAAAYGLYTILTYIDIRGTFIIVCLSVTGTLSLICAAVIMLRKIKKRKHISVIIRRRAGRTAFAVQLIMCSGLMFIMAVSGVDRLFGSAIMKSKVSAPKAISDEQSLANNIEVLTKLREDVWCSLSAQERLDVLQTAANVEQRYLGLPNELNIGTACLEDDIKGKYIDNTHEIIIDLDSLMNDTSWEVLDTVCHEAYHSYQGSLAEAFNAADDKYKGLRIFNGARKYAYEFENYIDGHEDPWGYYDQNCEIDARDYAEKAVYDYYQKINEYVQSAVEQQSSQ